MKNMIKWIKGNWTDPVWSKVFAGLILALLSAISVIVTSLIKKIPISDLYSKSIENYVMINYFSIILTVLIFLTLLIPAILLNIIKFQLKNIKFPSKLQSSKFDLQDYLTGTWYLTYENQGTNSRGGETIVFKNGNQYFIKDKLEFVMVGLEFDEASRILKWSKMSYPSYQKHSTEELKLDNKTMTGTDTLGFSLIYMKE